MTSSDADFYALYKRHLSETWSGGAVYLPKPARKHVSLISALARVMRRLADILDPPPVRPALDDEGVERFLRAWFGTEQKP